MASKSPTMPSVTAIIVCWNNQDILQECIESIQKQNYKNINTIVIDNGSTDGSVKLLKKNFPEVTLIEPHKNLGFAVANNIGIKKAFENPNCQYVLLLNTDARIREDWVETMVTFAQKHPKGASFQSLTVDYYNHEIIDSCGILIDQAGVATQMGYRHRHLKLKTQKVFGVNAAAAIVSRGFLEAQPFGDDYFDSDLFMYLEDVDMAARAVMMGWENYFVNETVAYHMGSASSGKNPGFSLYMTYRNNGPVLIKNLPLPILIRMLPKLIRSEVNSMRGLGRERRWKLIRAIIKGRLRSLSMLSRYTKKRALFKQHWDINTEKLWELMKAPRYVRLSPSELGLGSEPVSVVLLSHNNLNTLESSIRSLKKQTYKNMELVIVDNGSTDGSMEYLRDKHPDITVVANKCDYGTAGGFNEGIVVAQKSFPEFIALGSANCTYDPNWLQELVATISTGYDIFSVSGQVTEHKGNSVGYALTLGRFPEKVISRKKKAFEIFANHKISCLYRAELLTSVGLFDSEFFNTFEDVDLAFRARLRGYHVLAQPRALAKLVGDEPPITSYTHYHELKNNCYIYIKNVPLKLLLNSLPSAIANGFQALVGIAQKHGLFVSLKTIAKCIIKAPRMLRSRRINQQGRNQKSAELEKSLSKLRSFYTS